MRSKSAAGMRKPLPYAKGKKHQESEDSEEEEEEEPRKQEAVVRSKSDVKKLQKSKK